VKAGHMNAVSHSGSAGAKSAAPALSPMLADAEVDVGSDIKFCAIDDPTCEACQ
jgi:ribonucleoside-diphosphate reductase alpha chain